jgi:hypothetical protein
LYSSFCCSLRGKNSGIADRSGVFDFGLEDGGEDSVGRLNFGDSFSDLSVDFHSFNFSISGFTLVAAFTLYNNYKRLKKIILPGFVILVIVYNK